jgi:hypothetical protein
MVERQDQMLVYGGRNHANHTGRYQPVELGLTWLPQGTIVDGELVKLLTGRHLYIVFDVLTWDGEDIRKRPWHERREQLEEAAGKFGGPVLLNKYALASQEQYEEWIEKGYEGAIAKKVSSTYQSGKRSWDWQKCKPEMTAEAKIVSFEMGRGKNNGHLISSMTIRMIDPPHALTSTAVGPEIRELAMRNQEALIGRTVQIDHFGIFGDTGKPRHPNGAKLRPDLDAA